MKSVQLSSFLCGLAAAVPLAEPKPSITHISHMRRSCGPRPSPLHSVSLTYPYGARYFYTDISIGGQPFTVSVDLGSSDLWVASSGFKCVAPPCGVEATFNIDSTFTNITDEIFLAPYGAGVVSGITGFETVLVAGLTVPKQQIGVVDTVSTQLEDQSSGIMGLAFPGITAAYAGSNLSAATNSNKVFYSSMINTIFEVDNLTAPLLSLALSRDTSGSGYGGVLALGGVIDRKAPTVNASSDFASVPIELDPTLESLYGLQAYGHYFFNISGITYSNGTAAGSNETSIRLVADSGAPTCSLPRAIADRINAMWDPPAALIDGAYIVECNATAPLVTVTIGSGEFPIYPPDLIVAYLSNETAQANSSYEIASCLSGIQRASAGSGDQYILGEPFLKNVLGVFDWGNHEIRYASREYYES